MDELAKLTANSAFNLQTVRASVVQSCTQSYSLSATLDKLDQLVRLGKERDQTQLMVFPEAFIGGYPKMSTFGAVVGERSDAGRDEFLRYHSSAIDIPSFAISRMEAVSAETGVFLVVGVIERDGGTLYCTVVFVDPDHGYIAKHRKLVPTASERVIWGQGDGTTIPVIQRALGPTEVKLAAAICWENYMPLLRYHYYSHGVQLYLAPTVDARPDWQHTMVHIALEGRCFVLAACQFAQEKDFPPDHPMKTDLARDPENIMIGGGSVIVGPLGKVLAGPLLGGEGVLTADIDLRECVRGKFDLDVVGHYARQDVFSFKVNTTPFH